MEFSICFIYYLPHFDFRFSGKKSLLMAIFHKTTEILNFSFFITACIHSLQEGNVFRPICQSVFPILSHNIQGEGVPCDLSHDALGQQYISNCIKPHPSDGVWRANR